MHLIVTSPFGGYATGHRINEPGEIVAVRAGEHAGSVVAVAAPEEYPAVVIGTHETAEQE